MPEMTTIIRVKTIVHENWPGDPHELARDLEDHLWETWYTDGELISVEWVPESEVKLAS